MENGRIRGIVIGVVCAIVIALGCWRLRFDADVLNLLPRDLPAAVGIQLYQTNFANARELMITVQASDPEVCEAVTSSIASHLSTQTNLATDVVWQPLWMQRPADSSEFIAYTWLNQSPETFSNLCERLKPPRLQEVLAESRETLATSFSPETVGRRSYDPLGLTEVPSSMGAQPFGDGSRLFASADGTFRLLFLKPASDISDYRRCTVWLNQLKEEVARHLASIPQGKQATVRYTGRPAFVSEISSGMQSDLAGPSALTLGVIAALFYWTHRRIKPLLWLVVLLLFTLAATCAAGGLMFGALNIVSFGFASILLGLAEDFAVVLYEEARAHPGLKAAQVRAIAAPGIVWSTVTTASAFLVLNLAGLPGLGQLGTLVAAGVCIAAVVMLYGYLPPLLRGANVASRPAPAEPAKSRSSRHGALTATVLLLVLCSGALLVRQPAFDNSPAALRPKRSEAYLAADEIKQRMDRAQEPLWVVVRGRDETTVANRLHLAERALAAAVSNGTIAGITLPVALWPQAEHQRANIAAAQRVVKDQASIREAILTAGFTTNAGVLAESIIGTWNSASLAPLPYWPTNEASRWILEKFTARTQDGWLALGLIERPSDKAMSRVAPAIARLSDELAREQVYVSGWELLGAAILERVRVDFWKVIVPMVCLVLVSLWLAFRAIKEVLLCLAVVLAGGIILWAVMAAAGWSWNLMNLMAIPLLLGMGVDFAIHIQLALRRSRGNMAVVRGSIGRALLLAASTTVAGFTSLAISNNAGLASLGKVCGTGIAIMVLVSVYLLPHWWQAVGNTRAGSE